MNLQNIKTSPITAIEALTLNDDNTDLELIGKESLSNISIEMKNAISSGSIDDSSNFIKVFGPNVNFFYIIECINNGKIQSYERGIAYVYSQDDRVFLKRVIPILSGPNSAKCYPSYNCGPYPFSCCNNGVTIIYSCLPQSFLESIPLDNCVLASHEPFVPQPIRIDNNSILGRLDDNLQSLSFDDINFISRIVNSICKFTKQIKLKTSKLSLQRSEQEVIDLVPCSNVKAKKGSLYYDENDNTVKVYDGNSWRTLGFVD